MVNFKLTDSHGEPLPGMALLCAEFLLLDSRPMISFTPPGCSDAATQLRDHLTNWALHAGSPRGDALAPPRLSESFRAAPGRNRTTVTVTGPWLVTVTVVRFRPGAAAARKDSDRRGGASASPRGDPA